MKKGSGFPLPFVSCKCLWSFMYSHQWAWMRTVFRYKDNTVFRWYWSVCQYQPTNLQLLSVRVTVGFVAWNQVACCVICDTKTMLDFSQIVLPKIVLDVCHGSRSSIIYVCHAVMGVESSQLITRGNSKVWILERTALASCVHPLQIVGSAFLQYDAKCFPKPWVQKRT